MGICRFLRGLGRARGHIEWNFKEQKRGMKEKRGCSTVLECVLIVSSGSEMQHDVDKSPKILR